MARAPSSTPDLGRIGKGLADVKQILDELSEKSDRAEARQDRTNERVDNVEAAQEDHARKLDRLAQKTENATNEILATQTNSYRAFMDTMSEFRGQLTAVQAQVAEARVAAQAAGSEAVSKAAEGAASGVVKGQAADAFTKFIQNRWTQTATVALAFTAIVTAASSLPRVVLWIGHTTVLFFTWFTSQKAGVN